MSIWNRQPSICTYRCVTYRLTDGKQINGDGSRVARPLGYVMEIWPGQWVARVGNLSSLTLPLSAAKKAAIELYRSKGKREPRDWIAELHQIAANEIDRAAIERERRRKAPPPAFEELADQLREEMSREAVTAQLDQLRSGAKIEKFNMDGSKVEAKPAAPAAPATPARPPAAAPATPPAATK
jgi:biotin operon repressor